MKKKHSGPNLEANHRPLDYKPLLIPQSHHGLLATLLSFALYKRKILHST